MLPSSEKSFLFFQRNSAYDIMLTFPLNKAEEKEENYNYFIKYNT